MEIKQYTDEILNIFRDLLQEMYRQELISKEAYKDFDIRCDNLRLTELEIGKD